jgi:hypothetical protein
MKKMAVTWVDKNESFFKRTHNRSSDVATHGSSYGSSSFDIDMARATTTRLLQQQQ